MNIKKSVKDQLSKWPAAYETARWLHCLVTKGGAYEESASHRANRLLENCEDVVFVQVGANDGLRCDPIQRLAKRLTSWHGVFVEPVDFVFKRLVANYKSNPRFQFINKAVGEKPEQKPFYYIPEDAASQSATPLPFWYDQISSFNKNHILELLGPEIEPFIRTVTLDVVPLQSILDECGIQHLDVLHIDVEGYDWQVLRQLNFSKYRPAVILFENKHVTAQQLAEADSVLISAGYELYSDATDTLCIHPESMAKLRNRRSRRAA